MTILFEISESDLLGRNGVIDSPKGKIRTPSFVPVVHPEISKNLIDVSELNLSYKLKSKIPFDVKKNTLVTYLEELKEFDNGYVSKPVKFSKKIGYFFVLLLFGFFSLIFFYEAFLSVIKVFQNKFLEWPDN